MTVIVPLESDLIQFHVNEELTYISAGVGNSAYVIACTETLKAINSNIIKTMNGNYIVNTLYSLPHAKLVQICGPTSKVNFDFSASTGTVESIKITLPWPDEEKLLFPIATLSMCAREFTINTQLYRLLCIHALRPTTTFETLKVYAVQAVTKRIRGTSDELMQIKVDSDSLACHTILAWSAVS